MMPRKKAVVVGATNGIGKACSHRLAEAGYNIIAVGRAKNKNNNNLPGNNTNDRAEALIAELNTKNPPSTTATSSALEPQKHEFRACDAFSLKEVKECAESIVKDHKSIDALVMTQGMATIQSYTETVDGNDEKLTLHYWSRMAFVDRLLPSLRRNSTSRGHDDDHHYPCVISILSGGVHSPYKKYKNDPFLKKSYSIKNAADAAGYYNDLFLDVLARRQGNEHIRFIHAAPGFVNSNWGTEMPWFLKYPIRGIQGLFGMDPMKCAENMCDPMINKNNSIMMNSDGGGGKARIYILNPDATEGKLTKAHTKEAMDTVWNFTSDILGKVGIDINKS